MTIISILILTVYVAIGVLDQISIQIGFYSPLFAGAFTGFVLGDLKTGLIIGATLQLMTLGVANYGGASVPDYLSGAIIGTAYTIISKEDPSYGIAVAVPIGLLLTNLDILGRMVNTFVQRKADRNAKQGNYKGVELANILGMIPWVLSRCIPVFLGLFFGSTVVEMVNSWIPQWLMTGLKTAGAILPAMGIAILMRYLPLKKYYPYFILGFVVLAYLPDNFTVLGVALLGVSFAALHYARVKDRQIVTDTNHVMDDEEVEIDG